MKRRYDYLENLYKGFHDIFKLPDKESWKPDHRLAVNFPRYITDTFVGYGYGIPIKVTSQDEQFQESLIDFTKDNELTDHEAEMIKKCCVYGHAFEYIYQNEFTKTKVTALSPKDIFVVYDNTMSQRALFAIRYGYIEDKKSTGVRKLQGELLTKYYTSTFLDKKLIDEKPNPYGYIPVVEWRLNDDRIGLYENVAGLVEEYNHAIGEKANDVDAFAEAYLSVIGAEVDEKGYKKIKDNRLINLYGTDDPKSILVNFLQKPSADDTQENLLNRLENLIYQTSMVANISDESFGNATSGTALAYKLQAMSNLALTFDRKIEKSLRKRYKIFCSLSTNSASQDAYIGLIIKFTRNLPKNILEEADAVNKLQGFISAETALGMLSVVENPQEEMEKLEKERSQPQPYDFQGE